jgi:predicted metal-dependent hydrolase
MQILVSDVPVEVEQKNIKNMHLYVKPPAGNVVVSAPTLVSKKAIENFVRSHIGWIKKQQEKYAMQPRQTPRQYVSGETYYIFGKQYYLVFKNSKNNSFKLDGDTLILEMKDISTTLQRETYFRKQCRKLLKQQLDQFVPKWEETIHLSCESYHIKYMTTKWGTCNSKEKRIWINLQMVEKPLFCLDYVILHELIHLKIENHGKDFVEMMNKYMTTWKDVQKELNECVLDKYKE